MASGSRPATFYPGVCEDVRIVAGALSEEERRHYRLRANKSGGAATEDGDGSKLQNGKEQNRGENNTNSINRYTSVETLRGAPAEDVSEGSLPSRLEHVRHLVQVELKGMLEKNLSLGRMVQDFLSVVHGCTTDEIGICDAVLEALGVSPDTPVEGWAKAARKSLFAKFKHAHKVVVASLGAATAPSISGKRSRTDAASGSHSKRQRSNGGTSLHTMASVVRMCASGRVTRPGSVSTPLAMSARDAPRSHRITASFGTKGGFELTKDEAPKPLGESKNPSGSSKKRKRTIQREQRRLWRESLAQDAGEGGSDEADGANLRCCVLRLTSAQTVKMCEGIVTPEQIQDHKVSVLAAHIQPQTAPGIVRDANIARFLCFMAQEDNEEAAVNSSVNGCGAFKALEDVLQSDTAYIAMRSMGNDSGSVRGILRTSMMRARHKPLLSGPKGELTFGMLCNAEASPEVTAKIKENMIARGVSDTEEVISKEAVQIADLDNAPVVIPWKQGRKQLLALTALQRLRRAVLEWEIEVNKDVVEDVAMAVAFSPSCCACNRTIITTLVDCLRAGMNEAMGQLLEEALPLNDDQVENFKSDASSNGDQLDPDLVQAFKRREEPLECAALPPAYAL